MRWRPRYSLRTLAIFLLLVTSGTGLWWRWEPWYLEKVFSDFRYWDADWSPDGTTIAAVSIPGGRVHLLDSGDGSVLRSFDYSAQLARFTADGTKLVAVDHDGGPSCKVRVLDQVTGKEGLSFAIPAHLHRISRDGSVLTVMTREGPIRTWELVTGEELSPLTDAGACGGYDISADGRLFATGDLHTVRISHLTVPSQTREIRGALAGVGRCAFSWDGSKLATWGVNVQMTRHPLPPDCFKGAVANLWDVKTGRKVWERTYSKAKWLAGSHQKQPFAFSRDDRYLAVPRQGGPVLVLDVDTGRELYRIDDVSIYRTVWSPDGRRLLFLGRPERTAPDGLAIRIYRRRRPEWWWGVFWLWEFWLTAVFSGVFVWSVWRDRRALGKQEAA